MGFSNGSYCKIKEVVEKHDNYSVCKITVTKKNKLTNEYELQESQGASANVPYNPYDNGVNFEDLSSNSDDLPFNLGLSLP